LEARLRYDFDPRQRLRRDGAKLAAGLDVVALIGAVYVVRTRRRRRVESPAEQDWLAAMPADWRLNLQELLAEAAASGHLEVAANRSSRSRGQSLLTKLVVRAARTAAPMVLSAATERIGRRQSETARGQGPQL
ncbi:MAG: hypothetical protein WB867_09420, partial [Candidatus Dormiibacterota bacterium]